MRLLAELTAYLNIFKKSGSYKQQEKWVNQNTFEEQDLLTFRNLEMEPRHGITVDSIKQKADLISGPFSTVWIRLCAENFPSLGASPLQNCSSSSGSHSSVEAMCPGKWFSRSWPFSQAKSSLTCPNLETTKPFSYHFGQTQVNPQRQTWIFKSYKY